MVHKWFRQVACNNPKPWQAAPAIFVCQKCGKTTTGTPSQTERCPGRFGHHK